MESDDKITPLKDSINAELSTLSITMKQDIKNENVYKQHLQRRLEFLQWVNLNWKLRTNPSGMVIKQKEIFYCELGINIGSEQNGKRPVVIIQNNKGNNNSETVIIVPITTYDHSTFFERNGKEYIKYFEDGAWKEHKLDFYEIKIEIEPGFTQEIVGIANIVHMREISKKRLKNTPVATVIQTVYEKIITAIRTNLSEI